MPVDGQSERVPGLDSLAENLDAAHVGVLEVDTGTETRAVGTGDVAASVRVEAFEMRRACAGRRTAEAIASYRWSGDADAFVVRISRSTMPATDVGPRPAPFRRSAPGSTTRRGARGRP
jgi:hypothetical protein